LFLTVGTNEYRRFESPFDGGRIDLFNIWFKYYWQQSEERVIVSSQA
jgi:hypothetical protein